MERSVGDARVDKGTGERGGNREGNSSPSRCLVVPKRDRGRPMGRNAYTRSGGRKRAQNASCQPQNALSRECVARCAAHKKLPVCPHIHVGLSARPGVYRHVYPYTRSPWPWLSTRHGQRATWPDLRGPCTPFPPWAFSTPSTPACPPTSDKPLILFINPQRGINIASLGTRSKT